MEEQKQKNIGEQEMLEPELKTEKIKDGVYEIAK